MTRDRGIFERPKGSGIWYVHYKDEHGRLHKEKVGPKGLRYDRKLWIVEPVTPAAYPPT